MSRILVVDDQKQDLYLLKSLLAGNGYQVIEATNGAEALELARAIPPDVIISDILMPVMDGFSLCHEWMKNESLKNIPFVFYTATYTDPKDEELALNLGAARFIVKPTETEEFISILRGVLAEVEAGVLAVPHESLHEEMTYYRMYNERLVRKLEEKMLELEKTNDALEEDIAQRKQAEVQLQRQLKRLQGLRAIDMAISASSDVRITLEILLQQVISLLGVDAGAILLFNHRIQTLEYTTSRGFHSNALHHTHLKPSEGYAGRAVSERHTVHVPDLVKAGGKLATALRLANEKFVDYYGTPLIAKGEVKGVLEVFHRSSLDAGPDWLDFLEILAGEAAIAIDNAQLFDGLQRSNIDLIVAHEATIDGWSRVMELSNKETKGHTQRVTELTLRLAKLIGVSEKEMGEIRWGALLHDIGILGIPDSILLKPGALTEEEWEIMRRHSAYAYEMLRPINYLNPALDIPYCHHEKWDGTGYPRSLKGEQIPIAARIFAVVDVWDAITSDRPYRKGWSKEQALEYIQEQSGKYFDPRVVAVFLKLITDEKNHQ